MKAGESRTFLKWTTYVDKCAWLVNKVVVWHFHFSDKMFTFSHFWNFERIVLKMFPGNKSIEHSNLPQKKRTVYYFLVNTNGTFVFSSLSNI